MTSINMTNGLLTQARLTEKMLRPLEYRLKAPLVKCRRQVGVVVVPEKLLEFVVQGPAVR